MAQAGFPWNGEVRQQDKQPLSEKALVIDTKPEETQLRKSISGGSDCKIKPYGSLKKKSVNSAPRQQLRFAPDPPKIREPVKRIPFRTIPAWIQDADEDDLIEAGLIQPQSPTSALVAHHHHDPSSSQRPLLAASLQQRQPLHGQFPTSSGTPRTQPTSRWISFARASAYPRERFDNEKVDEDWLNENFTDYSTPWLQGHGEDGGEDGSDKYYRAFRRKQHAWYMRAHFTIMRNPFVPLMFRLIVLTFAAIGMGLGASIYHENDVILDCIAEIPGQRSPGCAALVGQGMVTYDRDPSALMAIIVDVVAILYTIYITYDEYFSKPLGLRPPGAKVRLVLLDLFFIVFQAANISLAFNSISVDQGPCRAGIRVTTALKFINVCDRARALSAVLFISLIAWLLTFSVSILRYVVRSRCRILLIHDRLVERIGMR